MDAFAAFASIVAAVEEGRGVYDNIRKFIHYLLSCNAGEILVMLVASLLGWPAPLLAIHILWVNLVTDGLSVKLDMLRGLSDKFYFALRDDGAASDSLAVIKFTFDSESGDIKFC